jgi:glycosyltransferase involved in cell wall biosynthesis
MKILLTTPLFPPDIGGAAPYMKELAKRLAEQKHEVTVLTYGCLPEKVSGVSFICVNKKYPLLVRLFLYTFALLKMARKNNLVYAQNGSSVELPIGLIKMFLRIPLVMHIGDKAAHEHAKKHEFVLSIEHLAFKRAEKIIADSPERRPEILPFKPYPKEAFDKYEKSWKEHMDMLSNTFNMIFKNV